ncbi:MAG: 50S ribosomal protein L16 [Candidatus Paceibacterota bacterium]
MLFPKKVKHRKWQRMRRHPDKIGVASRGTKLAFGSYGIKTLDYARITSNQIEAARRAGKRYAGKSSKMWVRIFPDRPYTQKAAETPMGSGKGDLQGYEVEVLPGRMLFEIDGVDEDTAREAFRKATTKLPVSTKFVSREQFGA